MFRKKPITRSIKLFLRRLGQSYVIGINQVKEAISRAGYEVIFLRGMNLPETVAEIAARQKQAVGVSNL